MAATLLCQRCKLTTMQQRWQWQHCNITMHTSVTAVTTDSTVTAVFTLVWQRCAHHCESTGNWQRCRSTVSCHRYYTVMCTSSSQHCHYHWCHSAALVFAAAALCSFLPPQLYAHRCLTAVGFLLCLDKLKAGLSSDDTQSVIFKMLSLSLFMTTLLF